MTDNYCAACGAALTRQLLSGRERAACPGCGQVVWSHFEVGAGGLLVVERKVLLIQRNQNPNAGAWALPGGFSEMDEALDETAVREFREETGLTVRSCGLLATWQTPGADRNSLWHVFRMEPAGPVEAIHIDPVEVRQVGWFDLSEVAQISGIRPWSLWTILHYAQACGTFERQPLDEAMLARMTHRHSVLFAGPPHKTAG